MVYETTVFNKLIQTIKETICSALQGFEIVRVCTLVRDLLEIYVMPISLGHYGVVVTVPEQPILDLLLVAFGWKACLLSCGFASCGYKPVVAHSDRFAPSCKASFTTKRKQPKARVS